MPSYKVTFRVTTGWKDQILQAESREHAVHEVIDATPEGSEAEVCSVIETEREPEVEPPEDTPVRAAVASTGAKREAHHRK